MAQKYPFTSMQTQLLIKAAAEAKGLYKSAKNACTKAYLTQEQSAAYAMEGYADEAIVFLKNPVGVQEESAPAGATDEEKQAITELMFNHKVALRTGLLVMIDEAQGNIEEQQNTFFADPGGMEKRLKDLRKLESILRGQVDEQSEMQNKEGAAVEMPDEAEAAAQEPELPLEEGPFDAPPITAPLALMSGETLATDEGPDEVPDADFEILEEDDAPTDAELANAGVAQDDPPAEFEETDEMDPYAPERSDSSDTSPLDGGDALSPEERDRWLNEPLRTDPESKLDPRD